MAHEESCPLVGRMERDETGAHIAPVYIRVRPGWLEKWLFVAVFVQIMLLSFFIAFGSNPAREARDSSDHNTRILCEVIEQLLPESYPRYRQYCTVRR